MNKVKRTARMLVLSALSLLMFACATVSPLAKVQVQQPVLAKQGDSVYLSHEGSRSAREEFALNAVVPVYRYEGSYSSMSKGIVRNEVGKVKVTKDLGGNTVEAVVVEGSVQSGDAAQRISGS